MFALLLGTDITVQERRPIYINACVLMSLMLMRGAAWLQASCPI